MKSRTLLPLAMLAATINTQAITTIVFDEGHEHNTRVGDTYINMGLRMPNFRFHHAWENGVDFPFFDGTGAVIDAGAMNSLLGFIEFTDAVDWVDLTAAIQLVEGEGQWSATAYAPWGEIVDFVAHPVFDGGEYDIANLRLDAPGLIASVVINRNVKFGLDTISWDPDLGPPDPVAQPIPEAGHTIAFLFVGLCVLAGFRWNRP